MNQRELDDLVVYTAQRARQFMEQNNGSIRQQLVVIPENKSEVYMYVIADTVLHASYIAELIRGISRELGGLDVVVLITDARMKVTTREELKNVMTSVNQGEYSIAGDESNPEVLMIVGKSRGNCSVSFNLYQRTSTPDGDQVKFDKDAPELAKDGRLYSNTIPDSDLWGN